MHHAPEFAHVTGARAGRALHARPVAGLLAALLATGLGACSLGLLDDDEDLGQLADLGRVPAVGTDDTLDVATWNIQWFGHTGNGPSNEALQLENAADVIAGTDADIWGVQEIVSNGQFLDLIDLLPGYDGFIANDPVVEGGAEFYTTGEQKVGIVFKSDHVRVDRARLILTEENHAFAGRPPLEVTATVTIGEATRELIVIVLHAKASGDSASWERRRTGAAALKAFIDDVHAGRRVLIIGDLNDDIDESIAFGKPTPYEAFVDDTAGWGIATEALSRDGISTTVSHRATIDHQFATDEMFAEFIPDSATVHQLEDVIERYARTTSDHLPVITRWQLGAPAGEPGAVFINEILANEAGSDPRGEFVELVNDGASALDLSGWTLSDAVGIRHVFDDGVSLAPGRALVLFGSQVGIDAVGDLLSPAVASSTGALGLSNSGDSVILRDADGRQIDVIDYDRTLSGEDGVAMNRAVDGDRAAAMVLHDAAEGAAGAASSPGARADGSAW